MGMPRMILLRRSPVARRPQTADTVPTWRGNQMPRNPVIKHPSRKDLDILVAAAATLLAGQAGRYGNPTDGTIKDACETAAKIFDQLVEML